MISKIPSWFISLLPEQNSIKNESPWINYRARKFIQDNFKNNKTVFEYGSGGSTLFFIKQVKKIVSVEHNEKWYEFVNKKLENSGCSNYEYFLKKPQKLDYIQEYKNDNYSSENKEFNNFSFSNYVNLIDKFPDGYFDLVIVDGRSRASCIKRALPKIKKGGYLMLDNSQRKIYTRLNRKLLRKYNKIVFSGITPYMTTFEETTFWKIV